MLKDFRNKDVKRWLLLALVTLIIIVVRTIRYGLFQGKDWMLYAILMVSAFYISYYGKKKNQ
ncbi:MAG: hypothetical protein IPM95_15480 [Sphingobacteriales bacterium]|jgi:hypothetical protein|nr:hypothetical protein [Sphingobacteriales bacterium]